MHDNAKPGYNFALYYFSTAWSMRSMIVFTASIWWLRPIASTYFWRLKYSSCTLSTNRFVVISSSLKKPNILIPLPAASSRGDQLLNAASFEAQGYSIVLNEDDITTNLLVDKVHELYFNRQNYVDAMSKSHQMDAVKTIMELINEAADKKTN